MKAFFILSENLVNLNCDVLLTKLTLYNNPPRKRKKNLIAKTFELRIFWATEYKHGIKFVELTRDFEIMATLQIIQQYDLYLLTYTEEFIFVFRLFYIVYQGAFDGAVSIVGNKLRYQCSIPRRKHLGFTLYLCSWKRHESIFPA